jgi:hypothetical protein
MNLMNKKLNPNICTWPILLYGCEIWGTFNTFSAKFRHVVQNLSFDQIYCKQKAELLHQNCCKYILGVHKKSTNFAVLSELGRFPLLMSLKQ